MYQWLFYYYCQSLAQNNLVSEIDDLEDLRGEFNQILMNSKIDISQLSKKENEEQIKDTIKKIIDGAIEIKNKRNRV